MCEICENTPLEKHPFENGFICDGCGLDSGIVCDDCHVGICFEVSKATVN